MRVTTWVYCFGDYYRNQHEKREGRLTAQEIFDAARYWITKTQEKVFTTDIQRLCSSEPLETRLVVGNFNLYIDSERLLQVSGGLQFSSIREQIKHSVILPATHVAFLTHLLTESTSLSYTQEYEKHERI